VICQVSSGGDPSMPPARRADPACATQFNSIRTLFWCRFQSLLSKVALKEGV
jgi:hypothetical protein